MSSRIKITLPDEIAARLDELAAAAGEPVSRVAAQMVRDGLGKLTAAARGNGTAPADELSVTRAPWLEPYGGDREWRRFMWGSILALCARYPGELKGLKQGWWNDESQVETICALAYWREGLDDAGRDAREELEFQVNIAEFGRRFKQAGGGVTREWTPGAAPDEWLGTPE